ncbi:IclR family transcriptional regulator [Paenibacillus agricola]|uniref:IclR family transcriptional regulator n=1 Tax=Paenibacillus agricola TaxID=2716264 RepID=A0ABX0JB61_9BACL|nr:IclR family transcriptional regulator [Paenibacillus agricola]NHN32778.1 IclR family transcriptional regulator [Paenibacillus agricola]
MDGMGEVIMKQKLTEANSEQEDIQARYTINSIDKAMDVIEVLSEYGSLSLIDLASLVKQPKSSLFRIILTLEKRGFIGRSETDGKYCLGLKHLVITKNLLERNTLRTSSLQEMHKLVDKYGDTVNLCVFLEGEVLYAEIIEGTYALRMSDQVGSKAPLHATATGKAFAASLPEEEVRSLLDQKGLDSYTPNTIISVQRFLQELSIIREKGYSIDDQEIVWGARCIAAPIFNMFGLVEGAISLSGAMHRFPDDQLAAIAEDVKAAAYAISMKLGYTL